MVCISVDAVADDSPIIDETGLVDEGVCSIGILVCVNIFIVVEELWEGFETASRLGLGHICHGGRGVSKIYGH